ncbi:MAG: rRNA maturation RNase YbeY [Pirellulaceae bacterium]|jgi:probable rRNA maturation factor|nr:rRNA maturation RNase YbeY [Pirellulaceae bacterium]
MTSGFVIEVVNRQSRFAIEKDRLVNAVSSVVEDSAYRSGEISIAIVGDTEMHRLNRQFLDHDYPTDVLSFTLADADDFLAGEIVASIETAEREAVSHGLTREEELLLYVIHGGLHLTGLDDKDEGSRREMRLREKYFMEQSGIQIPTGVKRNT